jgi:hypothetical protein
MERFSSGKASKQRPSVFHEAFYRSWKRVRLISILDVWLTSRDGLLYA